MLYLIGLTLTGILFFSRKVLDSDMQNNFDSLFKKYGSRFGIDWKLLKAICIVESSLGENRSVKLGLENPKDVENSKSSDGLSWGLMQITILTAKDYDPNATAEKLNNSDYSVMIASKHIARLKKVFPNNISKVVKSYNQGEGATLKNKTYADGYYSKWLKAYNSIEGI